MWKSLLSKLSNFKEGLWKSQKLTDKKIGRIKVEKFVHKSYIKKTLMDL